MKFHITLIIFLVLIGLIIFATKEVEQFNELENLDPFNHLEYFVSKIDTIGTKYWIMNKTLLDAVMDNELTKQFEIAMFQEDRNSIIELNKTISGDGYSIVETQIDAFDYLTTKKLTKLVDNKLTILFQGNIVGTILLYQKCRDGYMRQYNKSNGLLTRPESTFHSYFSNNLVRMRLHNNYFWAPINSDYLLKYLFASDQKNLCDMNHLLLHRHKWDLPNMDMKINYIYPKESKEWQIENSKC